MNVMAEMPASKVPLAFGPAADAGAQVIVPHYIVSGRQSIHMKKCAC